MRKSRAGEKRHIYKLKIIDEDHLGADIRKRREYANLKVYELAKKVGVNPVYITQIERHGKFPSASVMKKIADALDDQTLFQAYTKIKFPVFHEVIGKDLDYFENECSKLESMLKRGNLSEKEKDEFFKRLDNLNAEMKKNKEKFRKIQKSTSKLKALFLERIK